MSSSANSGNDGRSNRQPAKRAFAAEFEDASEIFQDGDDERSPKFAVLPTGANANRVFAVGTLTQTKDVAKGGDNEYWQARVVDRTGTFFVYAGQYQPEAMAALRSMEAPEYVAVVGKPRSYETDDGDMRVSLTPESITVVDEATRDRWVVETAEQTLERIEAMDVEIREGDYSEDIGRALEAYNEDAPLGEYEQSAKEALAQVAGVEGEIEGDDESEAEARSE
ncbi:nucleic acid-binding protein [Halococcus sp. PRR34]|uniref:RPA family protein n=1 Tax=Halococcus sp. PRR34 TaxID=3020830 RepID=UPI00235EE9AB|nr:nucleic acid-binding protein [Halococcus sp. PRR34]